MSSIAASSEGINSSIAYRYKKINELKPAHNKDLKQNQTPGSLISYICKSLG